MKTIQINNTNVVELIRTAMTVATVDKKGLMSPSYFNIFNVKSISIPPGGSTEVGKVLGLLILSNRYINDAKATMYMCGQTTIDKIVGNGFDINFILNDGILTIKNNYGTSAGFTVVYQSLTVY